MIDLIIIKIAEHALRAINPPKAGIFVIHYAGDTYRYNKYPIRISTSHTLIKILFNGNTLESAYSTDGEYIGESHLPYGSLTYDKDDVSGWEYL
jgi:hypothetical protein